MRVGFTSCWKSRHHHHHRLLLLLRWCLFRRDVTFASSGSPTLLSFPSASCRFAHHRQSRYHRRMSAEVTSSSSPLRNEPSNIDHEFKQDPPVAKLPVPSLARTLERYLSTLEAVVSPAQLRRGEELVAEFGREGGVGEELHERLVRFADRETDNWAYDFWFDDMYMKNRLPLPVNSNPGMPFPRMRFDTQDDQFRFAAKMLLGILDYKNQVDSGALPVDMAPGRPPLPLCMSQYHRLLTSCRRPGLDKDRLVSTAKQLETSGACHVTVAIRGQFYILNLLHNQTPLSKAAIVRQLKTIHKTATAVKKYEHEETPLVGLMTSEERSAWARVWQRLAEDSTNRSSFEAIEQSLCVLCLDEPLPASFRRSGRNKNNKKKNGEEKKEEEDVVLAHQMLHGGGAMFNTPNRWFDKTFQLVVADDGACGLCYEHSAAEGVVVIQLLEKLLQTPDDRDDGRPDGGDVVPRGLAPPRRLGWVVDDVTKEAIVTAAINVDRLINDLDFLVHRFDEFGRDFPKSKKMSPDVFIQLSLQLTFYKVHGKLVSTYESAGLRRFRFGRVDNIRAATKDALLWVKAMDDENANEDEKLRLFRKAMQTQTKIMINNISGQGIDCHLLALREISKCLDKPLPGVFEDECYRLSNHFGLSTSQVATVTDSFMGYGAVVPDGYGVSYNPHQDDIVFCVASFFADPDTDSRVFASNLTQSLRQMRQLLESE